MFPGKLIINHETLKKYQLVVRKRSKAFLKIWSLSTPALCDNFIINEIGDEQLYRQLKSAKFDTRAVLWRNEILASLFILLQVLFSS